MRHMLLATGAFALLVTFGLAHAGGDPAAGKAKSASCAGCHGASGQGVKPNPSIAGQPEAKFIQAMKDYQSGKRAHVVMKSLAASLSDQDIANLAAYYASLKK